MMLYLLAGSIAQMYATKNCNPSACRREVDTARIVIVSFVHRGFHLTSASMIQETYIHLFKCVVSKIATKCISDDTSKGLTINPSFIEQNYVLLYLYYHLNNEYQFNSHWKLSSMLLYHKITCAKFRYSILSSFQSDGV